jgi:hypothetical protein
VAAFVGYPPARDLLARNYPQSEAVRLVVPAKDVIRYALVPLMEVTATSEIRSKYSWRSCSISPCMNSWICSPPRSWIHCAATRVHSSVNGSTLCLICWRACPQPVARSLPRTDEAADQECSFREKSTQVHRNASAGAGTCGGGRVKAPRFVDAELARRTLARRASQDVRLTKATDGLFGASSARRYLWMQIAVWVAFARASRQSARVLYGVPWPPSDVTR